MTLSAKCNVHKDMRNTDKYEIIIDGKWYRYCENVEDAARYAAQTGNAWVINLRTGWIVGRW